MGDANTACTCKYCGGVKAQREITASMSNILRTTPSFQSPTPSRVKSVRDKGKGREFPGRSQERRPRDSKVYAAVQRTIKPLKPSANVLKQPMLVERNNDLRAIYSKTSMRLRRFFREGEVVWCALEPPIPAQNPGEASIDFWPGVIDEIKLKTEPIPQSASTNGPNSSQNDVPHASSSTMQLDSPKGFNGRGPILEPNEDPLPWTIRQSTKYKVQLLAVSHSYTVNDDQVLPYQAYVPSDGLIRSMTNFPVDKLNFDKEALSAFNPAPGLPPPTFSEAVNAYATALQIASIISTYWCLTDDYQLRYSIPTGPAQPNPPQRPRPSTPPLGLSQSSAPPSSLPPSQPIAPVQTPTSPPPPPPTQPPQVYTLQMAIEAAGRHNAQLSRDLAHSTSSYHKNVTAADPNLSESEVRKISNRILGAPPPPNELVQTRFQGFWWGAERIWTDDFIRLKIPRRTLAPNGALNILAPSGPGREELEQWAHVGRDPAELGAGTRGVFLRLDGLITVDIPNGSGGTKKEARVCGMLYELAADDWDDPNEQKPTNGQPLDPAHSHPETVSSIAPDGHSKAPNGAKPNNDLPDSGLTLGNLLPQPPLGFNFRPILTPGYEFVGGMGLVSGRYYPNILAHPKMISTVQAAIAKPLVTTSNNLWALEGLSGGYFNSVDPRIYKKSRIAMMQDADKEALSQLQEYLERKLTEAKPSTQGEEDAMEVDDIFG